MAQQSALHMGVEQVSGIDRYPERLKLARTEAGAETIDYTEVDSGVGTLKHMTGGRGPTTCIDAVGMETHGAGIRRRYDRAKQQLHLHTDRGEALRQAIVACRKGGTLSILGVYGLMDKFPLGIIINKGLTVRTAQQNGQRYVPRLLESAVEGEIDPSYLATHRFDLEDALRGYDMFNHKEDGCVPAVFSP